MRSHITAILVVCSSALARAAQEGVTTRVSLDASGAQASDASFRPFLSADARFVAFTSNATNLVAGDTNGYPDVFVKDTQTGAITRVSVSSLGAQANAFCLCAAMTPDGRFVVFTSTATNLVAGDNNGVSDVFMHDRATGFTERVSLTYSGGEANAATGGSVGVSSDGRFVAFASAATNYVTVDTNGVLDVFVRDRAIPTTFRASLDSAGLQGSGYSGAPSLSADGRYCAFQSDATFDPADTNGLPDIYVRDFANGTTTIVSVSSSGALGDYYSGSAAISANGRYVAFESPASTLVPNDSNFSRDIFVRDLLTSRTSRVDVSSLGAQTLGLESVAPSISADGRYVAFMSGAVNLVPGDTNNRTDIFIHDTFTHLTLRASVDSGGAQANNECGNPCVSADGRHIGFDSSASSLVSNDTNGTADIFVREIFCWPSASYCEAGLSTNFCSPAMSASGTASATAISGYTLTCTGLEGQRTGLIFYGTTGRLAQAWGPPGGSLQCVKHPVQRTPPQTSGGTEAYCNGSISIDWLAFVAAHPSALGQPLTPGAIIDAQCWYRDPPAPKGTNLSSAIEFQLCP